MKRKQADYQAFVDLAYEHQGILHRICSIYARAPEDREDLYQDILMQCWRSYDSFNGRSKFSTWLYRVALNTALAYLPNERHDGDRAGHDDGFDVGIFGLRHLHLVRTDRDRSGDTTR